MPGIPFDPFEEVVIAEERHLNWLPRKVLLWIVWVERVDKAHPSETIRVLLVALVLYGAQITKLRAGSMRFSFSLFNEPCPTLLEERSASTSTPLEHFCKVLSGERLRAVSDLFRSPFCHNLPAAFPTLGPHVN